MNKKSYPKISIITPVLNSRNTIEKSIKSLIEQQYQNLEFLVFDGKSTDGTVKIINKYKKYITYFESKKDKGPNVIYNKGIDLASGDIIAFLNADDWYESNILFDIAESYHKYPNADMFSCGFRLVEKQKDGYKSVYTLKKNQLNIDLATIIKSGPVTNGRFIKPQIYKKYGKLNCFDNRGNYLDTADKEFFFNLSLSKINNIVINKIGYSSLKHDNSRTHNNNYHIKKTLYNQHIKLIDKFFTTTTLTKHQKKLFNDWKTLELTKLIILKFITLDLKQILPLLSTLKNQNVFSISRSIKKILQLSIKRILPF